MGDFTLVGFNKLILFDSVVTYVAVKIAVRALRGTERPVDVNTKSIRTAE